MLAGSTAVFQGADNYRQWRERCPPGRRLFRGLPSGHRNGQLERSGRRLRPAIPDHSLCRRGRAALQTALSLRPAQGQKPSNNFSAGNSRPLSGRPFFALAGGQLRDSYCKQAIHGTPELDTKILRRHPAKWPQLSGCAQTGTGESVPISSAVKIWCLLLWKAQGPVRFSMTPRAPPFLFAEETSPRKPLRGPLIG